MPCPLRALLRLVERATAVTLLLAAGMADPDDDPLASPIGIGSARGHSSPQRALSA